MSRLDGRRRSAAARTAILDVFDVIEHDGKNLRNCVLNHKDASAQSQRGTEAGILVKEHIAEDGPMVFERVGLGATGIVFQTSRSTGPTGDVQRCWRDLRTLIRDPVPALA